MYTMIDMESNEMSGYLKCVVIEHVLVCVDLCLFLLFSFSIEQKKGIYGNNVVGYQNIIYVIIFHCKN